MITQDYTTLVPAYGRDYKSKAAVLADFLAGKDFTLCTPMGQTYCSIRDFAPNVRVNLHYKKLTMIATVVVPAKSQEEIVNV